MAAKLQGIQQRDLIGAQVVDYDQTVDVQRLRRERLQRLQAEIAKADLGALILFDPVNVRYATGVRGNEIIGMRFKIEAHAIVPREGKPILYGSTGLEPAVIEGTVTPREKHAIEFWQTGSLTRRAIDGLAEIMEEGLKELGVRSERIGLDGADPLTFHALEARGLVIDDAQEPLFLARAVKTQDEVALIRQACAIGDLALWEVQQAIRPGITENELFAIMAYTNYRNHGERMDCKLMAAGGNTNPWLKRTATSRMVRPGDLVAMDSDMAGPLGYFADISRTFLCGDGKPNQEQLEAYMMAYDFLYTSIPLFKPGATLLEIAESVPPVPDVYKANRYAAISHGVGMSDEWPDIYFPDKTPMGLGNPEGELKENMIMCMEASFGREDGREQVKLEEQLLITADGPEIISHAPFDLRFFD